MAEHRNFKQLMKGLDKEYFYPGYFENKEKVTFDDCSVHLATYLFDSGFEIDEDSYNLWLKINNRFGLDMGVKVLYNLFHRNHDT